MKKLILALLFLLLSCSISFAENQQLALIGPVIAGGITPSSEIIGYDAIAETVTAASVDRIYCSAVDSPSNNGTVTSISIYMANSSSTNDIELGIYSGSPTDKVGTETQFLDIGVLSDGWHSFTVDYPVSSGTDYRICVRCSESSSLALRYDALSETYYRNDTTAWGNAWPNPWSTSATGTRTYSFKATVTP